MGQDGKCSQAALVQLRSDVIGQFARLEALLPLAKCPVGVKGGACIVLAPCPVHLRSLPTGARQSGRPCVSRKTRRTSLGVIGQTMLKLFEVEKALKGKPAEVRDQQEDCSPSRPKTPGYLPKARKCRRFPHTRNDAAETDCVAGHIGFELRCA
jgi:hypothetical protein